MLAASSSSSPLRGGYPRKISFHDVVKHLLFGRARCVDPASLCSYASRYFWLFLIISSLFRNVILLWYDIIIVYNRETFERSDPECLEVCWWIELATYSFPAMLEYPWQPTSSDPCFVSIILLDKSDNDSKIRLTLVEMYSLVLYIPKQIFKFIFISPFMYSCVTLIFTHY